MYGKPSKQELVTIDPESVNPLAYIKYFRGEEIEPWKVFKHLRRPQQWKNSRVQVVRIRDEIDEQRKFSVADEYTALRWET